MTILGKRLREIKNVDHTNLRAEEDKLFHLKVYASLIVRNFAIALSWITKNGLRMIISDEQ